MNQEQKVIRVKVFQLPTSCAIPNPNWISVKRDSPRHMTMLPGGGSLARAR